MIRAKVGHLAGGDCYQASVMLDLHLRVLNVVQHQPLNAKNPSDPTSIKERRPNTQVPEVPLHVLGTHFCFLRVIYWSKGTYLAEVCAPLSAIASIGRCLQGFKQVRRGIYAPKTLACTQNQQQETR